MKVKSNISLHIALPFGLLYAVKMNCGYAQYVCTNVELNRLSAVISQSATFHPFN